LAWLLSNFSLFSDNCIFYIILNMLNGYKTVGKRSVLSRGGAIVLLAKFQTSSYLHPRLRVVNRARLYFSHFSLRDYLIVRERYGRKYRRSWDSRHESGMLELYCNLQFVCIISDTANSRLTGTSNGGDSRFTITILNVNYFDVVCAVLIKLY